MRCGDEDFQTRHSDVCISAVKGDHLLHGVRQLEAAVRATVGNNTDNSE